MKTPPLNQDEILARILKDTPVVNTTEINKTKRRLVLIANQKEKQCITNRSFFLISCSLQEKRLFWVLVFDVHYQNRDPHLPTVTQTNKKETRVLSKEITLNVVKSHFS